MCASTRRGSGPNGNPALREVSSRDYPVQAEDLNDTPLVARRREERVESARGTGCHP